MTIELPEAVERSILAAVQSGRFGSPDEAVAEAWSAFERNAEPQGIRPAMTLDAFHRHLLAEGVLSQLPDPSLDTNDDDEPEQIEGEPLSETILRERR